MPVPYRISSSASQKGGAHLFSAILTIAAHVQVWTRVYSLDWLEIFAVA